MKRVAAVIVFLLACGGVTFALGARGGGSGDTYRVDAIFDNASFLIAGQDVRIAGAIVGSVKKVSVTPDNRARIAMEVDKRYGPFHADADCFIAPQSLIGERFMQCTSGSTRAPALEGTEDEPPTVPVTNTHSPVDPDLVVDTFNLPTTQRFSLIVNELGAGLAGNGEALNQAIRRANPAVQATDQVLRIVDRDRDTLGALIDRSDEVIGQLAKRRDRVASFVGEADKVATTAAQRRGNVAETIRRLPGTLTETKTSLDTLRTLAERSTPLLTQLRAAAAPATRLVGDVPAFAAAARPTLGRLGNMARVGNETLADGAKVVKQLRTFSTRAQPAGTLLDTLTANLRDRGVPEGLQTFVRNIALTLARFDKDSHIMPSYVVAPAECMVYASVTNPSCDGHFVKGAATRTTRAKKKAKSGKAGTGDGAESPSTTGAPQGDGAAQGQQDAQRPPTEEAPRPDAPVTTPSPTPAVPSLTVPTPAPEDSSAAKILDFLLGG